jgi:hypothetical protein
VQRSVVVIARGGRLSTFKQHELRYGGANYTMELLREFKRHIRCNLPAYIITSIYICSVLALGSPSEAVQLLGVSVLGFAMFLSRILPPDLAFFFCLVWGGTVGLVSQHLWRQGCEARLVVVLFFAANVFWGVSLVAMAID